VKFLAACITGARLPVNVPDWDSLLQLADYHRLTPLLARATRDYPKPAHVDTALRAVARVNTQRTLLLFAHTTRISAALQSHGIETLCLKGPLLAHQIYGDLSLRVSGDVDLLVPAAQFRHAAVALTRIGYVAGMDLDESAIRKHLQVQHDLPFAHEDGTLVELHADVTQPHYSYRIDLGAWFQNARTVEISGHALRVPAWEHALLLGIIHGTKHLWTRLDLLADTAGIIRQQLDWEVLQLELDRAGAVRAAAVAGYLLRDVLSIDTPLLKDDRVAARIARDTAATLLRQQEPSFWRTRAFDLAVRERISDRRRYVRGLYRKWRSHN
jgi:hypothetical protein